MLNLEPLAAQAAARMVGSDPGGALNLINKALMVLAEQGLFAFGLFLGSRKREQDVRAAGDVHRALAGLLAETDLAKPPQDNVPQADYYKELTATRENETEIHALQRVILTQQLAEIALTYGRYQAKARGG